MGKPGDLDELIKSARRVTKQLEAAFQPAVPFVLQAAVSLGAYTGGLASAQVAGMAARISCATPVAGPLFGMAGVGLASALAGQAGKACRAWARDGRPPSLERQLAGLSWQEAAVDAALGIAFFKVMGGRFSSVMPSNLAKPGAIARDSLPAAGLDYAQGRQRTELLRFFKRDGCHHCGSRRGGEVIGDHMPPNKYVKQAQAAAGRRSVLLRLRVVRRLAQALNIPVGPPRQRFYPQCQSCSQKQAAAIRTGKTRLVLHEVLHRGCRSTAWHWAGSLLGLRYMHSSSGGWGGTASRTWRSSGGGSSGRRRLT